MRDTLVAAHCSGQIGLLCAAGAAMSEQQPRVLPLRVVVAAVRTLGADMNAVKGLYLPLSVF